MNGTNIKKEKCIYQSKPIQSPPTSKSKLDTGNLIALIFLFKIIHFSPNCSKKVLLQYESLLKMYQGGKKNEIFLLY